MYDIPVLRSVGETEDGWRRNQQLFYHIKLASDKGNIRLCSWQILSNLPKMTILFKNTSNSKGTFFWMKTEIYFCSSLKQAHIKGERREVQHHLTLFLKQIVEHSM